MRYFILLIILTSCVNKFHSRYLIPRPLPKQVPKMVLTKHVEDTEQFVDTTSIGSMDYVISRVLVSESEVTNKYFCYFLNEDSIRTNHALLKTIIDLSHPDSKIVLKNDKYYPLKGYGNHPVILVSWWGAKAYGIWLSDFVNKQREEKGMYRVPNYRLPAEFEWMIASKANGSHKYRVEKICDSTRMHSSKITYNAHNIKLDTINATGVAGMYENVYEWTADDFSELEYIMDFSMSVTYYEEITADAVVRKHGYVGEDSCGRLSRDRNGFYSDTGFRIVQTCLGRPSGLDF